jgi:hypothetical protein
MPRSLAELHEAIQIDPWRERSGFSRDMEDFNSQFLESDVSDGNLHHALCRWLSSNQPCIFGRVAAAKQLLTTVFITARDIELGDAFVRDKIQMARTEWTKRGFIGDASGMIVLAVSPLLLSAIPDQNLMAFSQRLCELYLLQEIYPNQVYHDELFLEFPIDQRYTWRWLAGVNFFAAAGDGRWWHDHRIPGGVGFSINSVGHLARSSAFIAAVKEISERIGLDVSHSPASTGIQDLSQALIVAMRTIGKASVTSSGRATELINVEQETLNQRRKGCPVHLPPDLANKDYCFYEGWYHTDYTLPSDYFLSAVNRPDEIRKHLLEFSYLYDDSVENSDYRRMGTGIQVRAHKTEKSTRLIPNLISITENPRLKDALAAR